MHKCTCGKTYEKQSARLDCILRKHGPSYAELKAEVERLQKQVAKLDGELGQVAVCLSGKIEHKFGLDTVEGLVQSARDIIEQRDRFRGALKKLTTDGCGYEAKYCGHCVAVEALESKP